MNLHSIIFKFELFEKFLENAQEGKFPILIEDATYEKAWKVNVFNNAEFAFLLKTLFENKRFKNLKISSAPWKYLARIFLNESGKPFSENNFKNQIKQVEDGNDAKKRKEKMARLIEDLLQDN